MNGAFRRVIVSVSWFLVIALVLSTGRVLAGWQTLRCDPPTTNIATCPAEYPLVSYQWTPNNPGQPIQALSGDVVQAHVASDDNFINHNAVDYNWFLYPDWFACGLLSDCGNFCVGADVEQGRIECEWEIENIAKEAYGLPKWAWPTQGDRVYVVGNFIKDCAHLGAANSARAEIHPPRLLVTYRNAVRNWNIIDGHLNVDAPSRQGVVHAFGPGVCPGVATQADIFASSYGGGCMVDEAKPNAPFDPPWWQPVNDRDYEFDVKAPTRPSTTATLAYDLQSHELPPGALSPPDPIITPLRSGDGYHVKIPMQSWPDTPNPYPGDGLRHPLMAVAKTLFVGWVGQIPLRETHNYRVTVDEVDTYKVFGLALCNCGSLFPEFCGEFGVYAYVNSNAGSLLSGHTNTLGENFAVSCEGKAVPSFISQSFDVTLVGNEPLRVQFRGIQESPIGGLQKSSSEVVPESVTANYELGSIENYWSGDDSSWVNVPHTSGSGPNGIMGAEDVDSPCDTSSCFTVTYHITRLPPSCDDDLVVHFTFDDPPSAKERWKDFSGYAHRLSGWVATLDNGVQSVDGGCWGESLHFVAGPYDLYGNFDEESTTDAPNLFIPEAMTGMAWIKPAGPEDSDPTDCVQGTIFSKGGTNWFQIGHDNESLLLQNNVIGGMVAQMQFPQGPLTPGTWHHVAFARDQAENGNVTFYLDGQPIGSQTLNDPVPNSAEGLSIGNWGFPPASNTKCEFNGSIDEVQIYRARKSDVFIKAEYDRIHSESPSWCSRYTIGGGGGKPALVKRVQAID